MTEEKITAIRALIESFYARFHAAKPDDLLLIIPMLGQLHDEAKHIAYPLEPQ